MARKTKKNLQGKSDGSPKSKIKEYEIIAERRNHQGQLSEEIKNQWFEGEGATAFPLRVKSEEDGLIGIAEAGEDPEESSAKVS